MKNTFLNLSNHQVQDILEELGMLDDNGNCPYTAEEIFKSALEYSASHYIKTNGQEWSEEDERLCKCIIKDQEDALDNVKNDKYGHSETISDLKEMYRERIDWLKSLKQRIGG